MRLSNLSVGVVHASLAARPSLSPKKNKRGQSKEREGLAELAAFLVA